MKTISGDTSYRVKYASACLLNPPKNGFTRNFDNCFEMGDGDEVVRRIMQNAQHNPKLREAVERYGTWEQWGLV